MKFPCVLENALLIIRDRSSLSFATKRIGPPCCTFCYYCYLSLVTNYLAIKLLVTDNFSACKKYLAENCLSFPSAPHWVRHSYLSKGLRLIPYTCGSSRLFYGAIAWEWSTFGEWNLVRKHLYYVLKFIVTVGAIFALLCFGDCWQKQAWTDLFAGAHREK